MAENDLLVLKNISKRFGDVKAVNDISINIQRGELVSFIGPSGCGKTTLLRMIGGFHDQDEGQVLLDGDRVDSYPPEKRSTGMVFQNYALFPHMSVKDNVAYGLKQHKVPKGERKERIEKALSQVRLSGYENRKPSELSGGQQQRVAIARCLVLQPKVLLLDEPLSNLDANLRMEMREEIRRLKEELNLTIVFVTHDQEEALSISDRVVVLNQGTIQQVDRPDVVYNQPANEFVANFVGESNILNGSIVSEHGSHFFSMKDLRFEVENTDQAKGQKETTVMLRPERIRINEASPLKGKVIKTLYNGSFVRYFIQVGEAEIKVDEFDVLHHQGLRKDDSVGVTLPKTPHYIG